MRSILKRPGRRWAWIAVGLAAVTVAGSSGSLNVAVSVVSGAMPVAPSAGITVVTSGPSRSGPVSVVKVHT